MNLLCPPIDDFLEHGFWQTTNDSDGTPFNRPLVEFRRDYTGDVSLTVGVCTAGDSLDITLQGPAGVICHVFLSEIVALEFQSWDGERIIRVYPGGHPERRRIRIHYEPVARIVVEPA